MKERGVSAEEFRAPIPAGLPGNAGLPSALAFEPMKTSELFCFGHRGARGHEPENTLRSVRKALELGVDGIEVDVYLADGQLVVIHDDTLERTTNGAGRVAEKSFAYLRDRKSVV